MHPEVLAPETSRGFEQLKSQSFLPQFYLGGGTAVALHLGHRRSVDLDFFSPQSIDTLQLRQQVSKVGDFILDQEGPGTLHGTFNGVKVSFLEYFYPLLESFNTYEGISLAGIKDLCCMKLDAIAARGKKRDFYDVYAIAQQGYRLSEMVQWFEKKYQAVHYNPIHLLKSLSFFEDAESDPEPTLLTPMKWSEIKTFFQHEALKLVPAPRKS